MAVASPSQSASSVRLSRAWTQALRWLWVVFTILALVDFAISIVVVYQEALVVCDGEDCIVYNKSLEDAAFFEQVGVSLEIPAIDVTVNGTITIIAYVIIASVIFLKRSDEFITMMTAFTFVALGSTATISALQPENLLWEAAIRSVTTVGIIGLAGFLLIFPNGRFVPRWTEWLFIAFIPVNIIITIATIFDFLDVPAYFNLLTIQLLLPFLTQIYRYFRISKPEERQQAKWIIAAAFVLLTIPVLHIFLWGVLYNVLLPDNSIISVIILFTSNTALEFLPVVLPLAVLISIMRYGLWDIDFYINRGIVYLSLTALLAVIFTGIFLGLQTVFTAILGSSQLGIQFIIPTAIVLLLFNPVRTRLRHFVDRRFYGIKMDYTRVIESSPQRIIDSDTSTNIGQYHTTDRIGSGGMGEVYAGQDTQGKPVAIKVLLTQFEQNEEIKKRFLREAEATARLSHPNIVKILDFGEDSERLFIAMEYVEGQDWGTIVKSSGAIPLEQLLPRLEELASALDYVHENGIIHRDIKPSNVMIESGTNRAVLMDFGIAKIATELTALTGTSQIVGSLDYISPEQIQGQANIDYRTDIYSFGVMTYQLLTGELPFKKANAGALVMAHLVQPAPDATQLNPHIPDSVSDAIQCAMAKQPTERFDTVSAFVAAMQL